MNPRLIFSGFVLGLFALTQPTAAIAATSVETLDLTAIKAGAAKFKGQIQTDESSEDGPPRDPLLLKYGRRSFETFKKHPELVALLKKLNPKFDPHTMATSSPSSVASFDGRTVLILNGCFPHNCGGTEQIAAFEPATKRVYLLSPTNVGPDTEPSGKFNLYGDPDPSVRAAMFAAYPAD